MLSRNIPGGVQHLICHETWWELVWNKYPCLPTKNPTEMNTVSLSLANLLCRSLCFLMQSLTLVTVFLNLVSVFLITFEVSEHPQRSTSGKPLMDSAALSCRLHVFFSLHCVKLLYYFPHLTYTWHWLEENYGDSCKSVWSFQVVNVRLQNVTPLSYVYIFKTYVMKTDRLVLRKGSTKGICMHWFEMLEESRHKN